MPVLTTAKTDVDRSLAVINGKSQFYNQSTAKTYEVEATRLTSDEAAWIDQLFSSYDVFRIEPDATNPDEPLVLAPVLITDCTCEIHDGDEKLNTVKFTWRHTDNRPIVRLSASPGIFTSPYHISTARTMLNSGDPVDISVWKSDGSILELRNVISLRYSFYGGWRNVKILSSGECRKIRDCCIFRVNDLEVFL